MTESDVNMLTVFFRNRGAALSAEYLSERALNTEITDGGTAVRGHVALLRKKLLGSGWAITERRDEHDGEFYGMEYTFERGGK
jgi:DNA-binding response OmpR family regulator